MSGKTMRSRYDRARVFLAATMALAVATPAQAGVIWCGAKVSEISVAPAGVVAVNFQGMGIIYMCNVVSPHATSVGNIPVDVCKVWVAQLMTAATTKTMVNMAIDYGNAASPSACTNLWAGTTVTPNPFPYWISFAS